MNRGAKHRFTAEGRAARKKPTDNEIHYEGIARLTDEPNTTFPIQGVARVQNFPSHQQSTATAQSASSLRRRSRSRSVSSSPEQPRREARQPASSTPLQRHGEGGIITDTDDRDDTSHLRASHKNLERLQKAIADKRVAVRRPHKKIVRRRRRSNGGLPLAPIRRAVKHRFPGVRFGEPAAAQLAGTLEYLCAEMLEVTGNCTKADRKKIIQPKHMKQAIDVDDELHELCRQATIPN